MATPILAYRSCNACHKSSCRGGGSVADLYKGEYNGLPDREVRTIRDLIHYQYAKIIARSALQAPDGTAAKANHYGFIKQTFRELHKKLFTYLRTSLNLCVPAGDHDPTGHQT